MISTKALSKFVAGPNPTVALKSQFSTHKLKLAHRVQNHPSKPTEKSLWPCSTAVTNFETIVSGSTQSASSAILREISGFVSFSFAYPAVFMSGG